jgi:hypothetical protein
MLRARVATWMTLIEALGSITLANSQEPPKAGIYQIQSGTYREVGGFIGEAIYQLPNTSQAFVSLLIRPGVGPAELTFLDSKHHPGFLRLTNGVVSGSTIQFQYLTAHPYGSDLPPAWVDYTVTNAAGRLWVSGSITSSPPACCDIPYRFEHRDVVATFLPTALSIRGIGTVELCWGSASNQDYQVQCRPDLAFSIWTNLGGPVRGNGTTNCVVDSSLTHPQRFYRIVPLP